MKSQAHLEPCITCDKRDCGATVILPSLASGKKHFDSAADRLDVECPSCNQLFPASTSKLEWLEVEVYEFTRGSLEPRDERQWPSSHCDCGDGPCIFEDDEFAVKMSWKSHPLINRRVTRTCGVLGGYLCGVEV
jgi:hypothetical protein